MPEYILYDKDGVAHSYYHMVDVKDALGTGLFSAEKPTKRKKKTVIDEEKPINKMPKIETKKSEMEEIKDKVKTKTPIDDMEKKIKEKK